MYRFLIRPLLYSLAPETAHHVAFFCLRALAAIPGGKAVLRALFGVRDPILRSRVLGLDLAQVVEHRRV